MYQELNLSVDLSAASAASEEWLTWISWYFEDLVKELSSFIHWISIRSLLFFTLCLFLSVWIKTFAPMLARLGSEFGWFVFSSGTCDHAWVNSFVILFIIKFRTTITHVVLFQLNIKMWMMRSRPYQIRCKFSLCQIHYNVT